MQSYDRKGKSMNPFRESRGTKRGDVWTLGRHRIMCGDSTNPDDVGKLMRGRKADVCFTSPPYGQQREYTSEVKAKVADWTGLMNGVFKNLPMSERGQVLVNLGLIHREGEWVPYWDKWIDFMRGEGWRRFGWYVWDQGPGLPGDWWGRLAPSHEFVFHFNKVAVKPQKFIPCKHAGQVKVGNGLRAKDGKHRGYTHSGRKIQATKIPDSMIRVMRHKARGAERNHPAVFPVNLPGFGLQCWPGLAYEPFSGSGSTIIAAEQLGQQCYGMEITPEYVDITVERWEQLTGQRASL
jgi:DNA modification methylase